MGTVRREHLVYRSDFTVPSEHWRERKLDKSHSFFRNGYFYIAANPPSGHATRGGIPITDFRVTVDAEFMGNSSAGSVLGVVFRNNNHRQFYAFNVNWDGHYIIWFFHDNEWDPVGPAGLSEFVKRTGTNSLMVEMVGQKMTVGVNGHALASATDSRLSRGEVGVVVSAEKVYSEARFRNFQLFSVEYVSDYEIEILKASAKDVEREGLVMPVPIGPSGRQKTTQQPASTQRPPDLHAYLAGILEDGGMTDLNDEQREEMIQELAGRLNEFIIGESIDHMPSRYLEAFTKMHEQNRPQAEINRFIEEHVPNARQVFSDSFVKFRGLFVGKAGS